MILIIDTYNVLHTTGVLPPELAGLDVGGLARLIRGGRYAEDRAELICDGTPQEAFAAAASGQPIPVAGSPGGRRVRVRFAGADREADDLIAALIAGSTTPRKLMVVSSDQWVVRQARRRRCKTLPAAEFLRQLAQDAANPVGRQPVRRPSGKLPRKDVKHWMDVFDVEDWHPPQTDEAELPSPTDPPAPSPKPQRRQQPSRKERTAARTDGPLPADIIAQAERIWAEHEVS